MPTSPQGRNGVWLVARSCNKQNAFSALSIKHILQDLRLVQDSLKSSGQELPGVEMSDRLFKIVKDLDGGMGGEQGTQAMIRAYREMKH